MAEPTVIEIMEDGRAQPQHSPFDPVTSEIEEVETPPSQPRKPLNDPVATEILEDHRQQIDPELLRAIVNGDLIWFESIRATNSDNSGLGGVTCGENTALHVVAGVIEKSSPMAPSPKHIYRYFNPRTLVDVVEASAVILVFLIFRASSFIMSLVNAISFVFTSKRNNKHIDAAQMNVHYPKIFTVYYQWKTEYHQWKWQKKYELIEKARRTPWLKCVLSLPYITIHYKRRMNVEIAEIIYHKVPTLLKARNNVMETPLHCADKAGKLEMVSLLVEFARKEGPEELEEVLRARNKVGETALHEAARSGYSDVVEELLRADENLASLVDNNGISPLYWAVTAGCLDIVRMLIAPNRLTSYAGPDEQTALHAAVMRREETITRAILAWNPPLAEIIDIAGNTPLHYAALTGNTSAVRELLLKNTRPVYRNNLSGSFPMHLAAEAGNVEVIKELLSMCPDVGELLDKEERNFLHIAVQKKRMRVIMLAYQEGINANVINAKDKDGNTPLHLAVISSDSEIFALLSQYKRLNLNIRNKAGLTSLDLSASLQDHQFTYSLNPQSIIHRALVTRGAFQNHCQHDQSKKVDDFLKARADCPNRREGEEMWNGVEVDIEKESTKYQNMSNSLITGAVLIASATFTSIFTVSGVYRDDNTSHTLRRRSFFKAFIIVNVLAFICAIVSTIWLLYSALSNFHLKYRKFYFEWCTLLLYGAINLFILTSGLGGYIAIAPISEWLALLILAVSGIVILWNVIWNPSFVPLILLAPYMSNELDQ